jgi:uncharacterized protein (UPF0548 family)
MFLLQRPSRSFIDRFIDQSSRLDLSYQSAGITKSTASSVNEYAFAIGRGHADFERAKHSLLQWKQFDLGWTELYAGQSPIAAGTNVAVLIRHLGFWSLNGCRVVYFLPESPTQFGYAYGTLPTHAESGEELFEVFIDARTDEVFYRLRVMAGVRSTIARLGAPYVHVLQARFRRDSAAAMKRAIESLTA